MIRMDVFPYFGIRPIDDRMQVAFVSMPDARFDQFPIGTLAGFRVADASDNDAPSAAVFFQYLAAIPNGSRWRHPFLRN